MAVQTSIIVLAGYAYSRYNFLARKQSLVFFLIIQMVPTMAALTAFFVMALMLNALNHSWFLIFLYVGGGIPMNAWLMKGYFDTVPMSLDESAKLDGAGHFRRFWQIVLPLVRPMVAVQALWAFMGPFGDYILSSFLLREKEYFTVAVGLQTLSAMWKTWRLPTSQQVLSSSPFQSCILFFFLQKNFCFRTYKWWRQGIIYPRHPFHFILFENLFKPHQLSPTLPCFWVPPTASFLVCSLIFIEY